MKQKIFLLVLALTALVSLRGFLYPETNKSFWEVLNLRFQGVDASFGHFDLGLAPIISFSSWDFLMVKPLVVRWNPFTISLGLGMIAEYYPLRMFKAAWWIFGGEGIHPYIYTGLKVPISFQSLAVPVGIGLQGRLVDPFYVSARVFMDLAVAPVVYPAFSWEIAMEYKMLKF